MKTLVISDIHNRVGSLEHWLEKACEEHKPDEVVFLGDYFDSIHDTPFIAGKTAEWLKQSLTKPNRIHLIGNHDIPYMLPGNSHLWCPGFTPEKCRVINSNLTKEEWDQLRPAYFTNGWLLSHAGFCQRLVEHPINGIPDGPGLVKLAEEGLEVEKGGIAHPLYQYGDRMGVRQDGGIIWQDWFSEFYPCEGVNQIVGHTRTSYPREMEQNHLIDCSLQQLILITDTKVTIIDNNYV
jgi:hypothetical protein